MEARQKSYSMLTSVLANGRTYTLTGHGIEGLTTNLQSLVTTETKLGGLEVHLVFRLWSNIDEPNMGQERICGIGWTFYSLSSLVNMLLGRAETDPDTMSTSHVVATGCQLTFTASTD